MTLASDEMEIRCADYARSSLRKGIMKGLDPETLGHAAMIEALSLSFGIDKVAAASLTKACTAYSVLYLQAKLIAAAKANGEDVGHLDALMADLNNSRPAWALGLKSFVGSADLGDGDVPT